MMGETRKLNLGCGQYPKEGFVNVDYSDRVEADVVHDLNCFPYPFETNAFSLVEADHVLEHLHDPFGAMTEIHRILEPGGELFIRVPHFSRGMTHSDHKRGFDVAFPYYFNPSFKAGYTGVDFDLLSMRLRWFAQPYMKQTVLSPPIFYTAIALGAVIDLFANLSPFACSRLWCFLVGGFEEIEYRFRKPGERPADSLIFSP